MQTLIYLSIGFICVLIHCLFKAESLKKDATAANMHFNLKTYWEKDYIGITASFLIVILWLLLYPEVLAFYKRYEDLVGTSFGVVGFMGSYFLQLWLGKAKTQIRNVIDTKTNIADNIEQN